MTPESLDVTPPRAPLAMPKQVLERSSPGFWHWVLAWSGMTARPQG